MTVVSVLHPLLPLGTTFLFRFAGDSVQFHDLNMQVGTAQHGAAQRSTVQRSTACRAMACHRRMAWHGALVMQQCMPPHSWCSTAALQCSTRSSSTALGANLFCRPSSTAPPQLQLRKRKRGVGAGEDEDEEESFNQPEKVSLGQSLMWVGLVVTR